MRTNPSSEPSVPGVLVAGCGPLGSAFAHALERRGARIACVFDVSRSRARRLQKALTGTPRAVSALRSLAGTFDIIFAAVPDDAIADVAAGLAGAGCVKRGTLAFHPSGVLPADALAPLREQGAQVAALHPVQTFASFAQAVHAFNGAVFDIQGDRKAVTAARRMVREWGGKAYVVSAEDKVLLHIASVFSSNLINVLQDMSLQILRKTGASDLAVVKALTNTAVKNGFDLGPVRALTGPVARGDAGTVRMHLSALQKHVPGILPLYRSLSLKAAEMAQETGLDSRKLNKVIKILKE